MTMEWIQYIMSELGTCEDGAIDIFVDMIRFNLVAPRRLETGRYLYELT